MPRSLPNDGAAEALRREAADWFARMHGPDAERARLDFERWRAADPTHRAAYARLDREWDFARGLRNTALGRARQLPRRRGLAGMWGRPRYVLAGAALCLAAIVAGVGWHRARPFDPAVAATLASGVGQIRTLRLPDGSRVTLDTDSAVMLAFDDTRRVVRLMRGRARFDVLHDPARPFVVEAVDRSVVATGTLFDVALWRGDLRVSLLRGAVDVRRGTAPRSLSGVVAHLGAGQSCALGPGAAAPVIGRTPRGADRWV
ncbi:FecR domain-containing protein, partial [Sphingomonas sp. AR_OL41]|uniref:FecR family protein n=1 Tax=Sphingomonas sp. AR_OL41 TaxID=3042729 RepID=UPI00248113D0